MEVVILWLAKNWRLIAYGVAALVVIWFLALVGHWRSDSHKLDVAEQALKAEQDCIEGSACLARVRKAEAEAQAKQYTIDREVIEGYETGLRTISDYAATHPAPSVRLCRPASNPVVRVPDTASPADGSASAGELPVEASSDIGQRLFDLADAADREALKLRSLQDWNRSLSQKSE